MAIAGFTVIAYGVAIALAGALVAVTFAGLIPLDTVQSVTGVSIIIGVSYAIALVLWALTMIFYSRSDDPMALTWINTHMIFLVLLPGVIGATTMNVVTVQNTRNLVAGKITAS